MPEAPETGLFTRYILENPWPMTLLLVLGAIVIGIPALREGLVRRAQVAGALLLVAAFIFAIEYVVTTPAEHAERLTKRFVAAVVASDLTEAEHQLAEDVTFNAGSPQNPGYPLSTLLDRLGDVMRNWPIKNNYISDLDGYTESSDRGVVHLTCWTEGESYGPTPSQWVLRAERQDDGTWKITGLTCISINRQPPPLPRLVP